MSTFSIILPILFPLISVSSDQKIRKTMRSKKYLVALDHMMEIILFSEEKTTSKRDTTLKSKECLAMDSLIGTKLNSALEKLTILLKIPELKKTNK